MTLENASVLHQFGAAAVAAPPRVIPTMAFASAVTTTETERGTHIIEGIRIFKAGTFSDSMGIVRTWETVHLDQMVLHFTLLKDGGIFPNVPVRVDHSYSAESVVGYFVNVYRDKDDDNFLAADIEITEPDAFQKWERGTYRSRSLEVGMYETNGENPQTYFPVVMGLAFVDIPAVEGLHAKGGSPGSFSQCLQDNPKETEVTHEEFLRACEYAAWVDAARYAQSCQDWERAATYAQAVDDVTRQAVELGIAQHGAPVANQPITFSAGGQQVTMTVPEMAQELGNLMTYRQETIQMGRASYVDELAKHGKVAQGQVVSLKGLVTDMTEAQFTAFKASYDAAPVAALFGQFGGGGGEPAPGQAADVDEQIADLEEIVLNHRRRGASQEDIEKTGSFQKLQKLKAAKGQG